MARDADVFHTMLSALTTHYPDARIVLRYSSPWELLVAVMLSAQCTDAVVNTVCEKLFAKYKTVSDYADADLSSLERDVRPTGFFRTKAKHLKAAARMIVQEWGGEVPKTMEELVRIPGVARKTANIVLGNAFGIVTGVAVDTHVRRLSGRLGLTTHSDPDKIEQDLMRLFEKRDWFRLTYFLIAHGRAVCTAKRPRCSGCFLSSSCPSAFRIPNAR